MKVFLRLLVVFGIIDLVVASVEVISGTPVSGKVILGAVCLGVGIGGLLVLKMLKKG